MQQNCVAENSDGEEAARVLWQEFSVPWRFPVIFSRNIFSPSSKTLLAVLGAEGPTTILAVADAGVATATPGLAEDVAAYFSIHQEKLRLVAPLQVLAGGETCKAGATQVETLHRLFLKFRLCRHSMVVAIGGGAFLDVVGYAAATAHRGIRLVRVPTTTLAQNDAGIGVKNGYNSFGRKNWVGTFAPPYAVVNDFDFLRTLSSRQCRSGMAEAVKVAVIKDQDFFRFLSAERGNLAAFQQQPVEEMIVRCARLHLRHIAAGDPFERGAARPLDFGHWAAHALEEASAGEILHGEAVAMGMALDATYAVEIGLLSKPEGDAILHLLQGLGFSLSHAAMAALDLEESLDRFRQHLGGTLTITLPTRIGHKTEVHEINLEMLHHSRDWLQSLP